MRRASARRAALGLALACLAPGVALLPERAAGDTPYEQPGELRASQLLPPELLRGPHHRVEEGVESDGLVRIFRIRSDFGAYEARGEAQLRERIAEIEALAALREATASPDFARAAERAGPPPRGAPVGIAGLPVGVTPPRAGTDGRSLLDAEGARREIATRLGIDPYTTNPDLRGELERHAWVMVAGGMASRGAAAPQGPDRESDEVAPDEAAPRVAELLRSWSADDLERLNRIELAAMGVGEGLREEFLSHPQYSPRTGTVLVDALAGLEGTGDRSAFIEAAVAAGSEDEARAFGRMAQLIRSYGESSGGLQKITTIDGRVAAFAADGTLVVPVLADHALWTQRVARFTESVARATGDDPGVARARFLVSGSVSSRARREMRGRGIEVTEGAGGDARDPGLR